ncbi:MAG: S8 family serine peptidase, partial [Ruminococcus sp.]|nr:S8 family serine peptidase [Candidatus Copronaster equi]
WDIINDALKDAYAQRTLVVCSAGNYGNSSLQPSVTLPATSDYVLNVTGLEKRLKPVFSRGKSVDVSAPGREMLTAYKGSYKELNGTSFSSPLTASVCSEILTIYPSYTPEKIIDIIKETAVPYDSTCGLDGMTDVYGTGYIDAVEATGIERTDKVVANLDKGHYKEEIVLTLSSTDDTEIYYSLNQRYPTKETGILYTEPIRIYSDSFIVSAVAYSDNEAPSRLFSNFYRSSIIEDESNFEIDENGNITKYNGTLSDIIIPDTISSTEVKNILQQAFADSHVSGIVLPSTIKTLGTFDYYTETFELYRSFFGNQTLNYIDGDSVEAIGYDVFSDSKISSVNFPNCRVLGDGTFYCANILYQLNLPKVEHIGIESIAGCFMFKLWLPELKSSSDKAFSRSQIYTMYSPKFSYAYDEEGIKAPDILYQTEISNPLDWPEANELGLSLFGYKNSQYVLRLEFSKLKKLYDFPGPSSTLVLPSTVEYLPKDMSMYKDFSIFGNVLPTYTIYGSSGTYAESWAKKNEIKFIEITPETAVITDLPKYYKSYMGYLEADVVGFNKQYQWYANDNDSNESGTPIDGANDKFFNPADFPYAKYYYCVVTSHDENYAPITIRTNCCENRMFDKIEHSFDIEVKSPTCTENGYTLHKCTCGCGKMFIDNYKEAKGHNAGDWIIDKPATYLSEGQKHICCSSCGTELETQVIPKLDSKVNGISVPEKITMIYKCKKQIIPDINTSGDITYNVYFFSQNPNVVSVNENGE